MGTGEGALAEYSTGRDPATAAIVARVADAVTSAGVPLDAAIRWGRLTYAVDGDFHHWLCGIGVTRKGVTLQFHFGRLIADPGGRLVTGESRFLGKLEFPSANAVDAGVIAELVRAAADRLPWFRANWKAVAAGTIEPR